jgi:hypothetical protein
MHSWGIFLLTYAVCDMVCFKLWSDWLATYGKARIALFYSNVSACFSQ